jgi:hypothetical protein
VRLRAKSTITRPLIARRIGRRAAKPPVPMVSSSARVILGKETPTPICGDFCFVLSAFRPRGVPGPTSKLSLRVPAQMGRRETEHKGEQKREPRLVLSCTQGGCACSRGLQAFARKRERLSVSPSSRVATFSYEGHGPSFYRCKEKAQVYNGGCSNVLTCLAERSQSPMYMPSWLSERCWCPIHVMSWSSEERLSPIEA